MTPQPSERERLAEQCEVEANGVLDQTSAGDLLREAALALREGEGWPQDISTAAKTEDTDILASTNGKVWFQCCYAEDDQQWVTFNRYAEADKGHGWAFKPTLWMPLPPTQQDRGTAQSHPTPAPTSAPQGQQGEVNASKEKVERIVRWCLTRAIGSPRLGIEEIIAHGTGQLFALFPPPSTPSPSLAAVLAKRAYVSSEPHLSGYRVIIGFEKLSDAQDAHEAIAKGPQA